MTTAHPNRGLDWLNFFVANLQTAFGPFLSVYLTGRAWTQSEIGLALTIGTVATFASQVPAGAVVDHLADKRVAARWAIVAIIAGSLIIAAFPQPLAVAIAEVLHGFASCALGPAIAAISIAIAGQGRIGLRLGRNARYASLGNGVAAALMGAFGYYVSSRSVFVLGAVLAVPALWALRVVGPPPPPPVAREKVGLAKLGRILFQGRLLVFAGACLLFQLANAAMLPLAASRATEQIGTRASLVIAACIVVPQLVVAAVSPLAGRVAERSGRRLVLLVGFLALPVRGVLIAHVGEPWMLVPIQLLDGVSAASFGVMLPLVTADLTMGTGRYNLALGSVGLVMAVGAGLSTTLAGWIADVSLPLAFLSLATVGAAGFLLILLGLGETRP